MSDDFSDIDDKSIFHDDTRIFNDKTDTDNLLLYEHDVAIKKINIKFMKYIRGPN